MSSAPTETRTCAGCKEVLTFVGVRDLRTGGGSGVATALLGWVVEAHEGLLRVALYGCPKCGRLEMFLPPK